MEVRWKACHDRGVRDKTAAGTGDGAVSETAVRGSGAAADWAAPAVDNAVPGPPPSVISAPPPAADTAVPGPPPIRLNPFTVPATAPGRTDVSLPAQPLITPDGIPKMVRPADGRMLGGVAVGLAQHLKMSTVWMRAVFAILGVFAGAGVVAYALLWIFVPQVARNGERTRPTT